MHINSIKLTNFKNYEYQMFEFSAFANCIVGENGSGKTNLLDAIYCLCITKSAFSSQDILGVKHEEAYFMLDSWFEKAKKKQQVTLTFQKGQKKTLLVGKKAVERIADHIGQYPVVLIAPHDADIVRDGNETRRKFIDGIICQVNKEYLNALMQYNRVLLQRNSVLKQFAERRYFDEQLMEVYSEPLLEKAIYINKIREEFICSFLPFFQKHYAIISESREIVNIKYESEVGQEEFSQIFRENYKNDLSAQRSTKGIHKDDYSFEIDTFTLKKFGSQGQQKCFTMALRLAQFEMLTIKYNSKPILLMDDIFDKLDDRRIEMLIKMIKNKDFGQVFITDARPERTKLLLESIDGEFKYFEMGSLNQ